MTEPSSSGVRDAQGRFVPGCSGNPAGKKPGTLNWSTRLRGVLPDDDADRVMRKVVERALDGSGVDGRFVFAWIEPKPREQKLYATEAVVDRGFEDVEVEVPVEVVVAPPEPDAPSPDSADATQEPTAEATPAEAAPQPETRTETRRINWTIVKRTMADLITRKPMSTTYVLKRDEAETEFPSLSAAREVVHKTIVHPEKLTRSKEEHALSRGGAGKGAVVKK